MSRAFWRRSAAGLAAAVVLGLGLSAAGQTSAKLDPKATEASVGFPIIEEPTRIINQELARGWQENKIQAAPRCDDYDFIRRASLDIIGRIATVDEIERYVKDPPASRRAMLVERLLASEEYAAYWSNLWTHWLLTRQGNRIYHTQLRLWLEELFVQPAMSIKEMANQLITATGKTNENGAVTYILAHLGEPQRQAADGGFDMVPVTSRTMRIFLGYQLQCAQCHCHPFNAEWDQRHFWGVNAFFRQVQRVGNPQQQNQNQMMNQAPILELRDDPRLNDKAFIFYEKVRNGVYLTTAPVFLDGRRLPRDLGASTRRQELAKHVTGHKNFAPAYVNRMWGHFFGRGLGRTAGYDDFGEHNEIIHPELLEKVSEHFIKSADYDPRKLIRWITASDAYNLKPESNKTNDTIETDALFSRMPVKMMSPEQLLESLFTATKPAAADRRAFRDQWLRQLVQNFGDDEGTEAVYNGTILQALLMMNSREITQAVARDSGTVATAAKLKTGPEVLRHLYLSTLNRPPTPKEYQQIVGKLALPRGLKDAEPLAPMQDVFWALLNVNEFILNH